MRLQKEVYNEYRKHIEEHFEENRKGALAVRYNLEHSPLYWNGMVDKTVQIPKVYDKQAIEQFRSIARTAYGIFGKVIREYREHEDYRKLFPYSKELEELILLPTPYDGFLPIARFDLFYDENSGDFMFCEINTDGTAAMLRDLEMRKALINNPAHQAVIRKYDLKPFELFDTWVKTFLSLYETYGNKVDHPGVNCEICDIRSLSYRDGVLYSPAGNKVDAVYRRAVTADILDHYEEVTDFLQAVRDDAVFFAGAFATQIIHSKWLFHILHLERTKSFLTEEEREFVEAHIPATTEFSKEFIPLEKVQGNKDRYMIKPMDAYASKGVYAAGPEYSQEDWEQVTAQLYGKGYICQTYCRQYLTDNIDFAWGDGTWQPYINMPGLYVYNGEFSGFLMRMACGEKIIVAHENERTVPVFMV